MHENKLFDMQFRYTGDVMIDGGITGRDEGPENLPAGGGVSITV